jgi:CheY-like chemotaxis protein
LRNDRTAAHRIDRRDHCLRQGQRLASRTLTHNLNATLPVIVLTGDARSGERALADSLGADAYLTKPFSPLQLLNTIERLVLKSSQLPAPPTSQH